MFEATDAVSTRPVHIDVVIPALNEEQAIGEVLRAIPPLVRRIVVVDNGSSDGTAAVARAHGADVVMEPRRGYGAACLRGLSALQSPDIVVFMDADRSDDPQELNRLIEPIIEYRADLVIGSRVLGDAEPGSLSVPQRFGNALASWLIRRIWRVACTDLGPFRAVRFSALLQLQMSDLDYGWTVQMQARAARRGLRTLEVPVSYRARIGRSKISGTLRGVIGAGTKILGTIAREALAGRRDRSDSPAWTVRTAVFTRVPREGTTKTRMIPAIGAAGAAALQAEMTRHTLVMLDRWRQRDPLRRTVEIRLTGGSADEFLSYAPHAASMSVRDQGEGTLGTRMLRALREGLASQSDEAGRTLAMIVIGSDCPEMSPLILEQAVRALERADVVLGPASDGGYYLVGMRRPQPALFQDIEWGTARVLEQTRRACRAAGLRVSELDTLHDLDEAEDLVHWQRALARGTEERSLELSVVIPALNEEAVLRQSIESVGSLDSVEVIVADGGSRDGTLDIARSMGAHVVLAPRGRGAQMNAGAAAARGEVLLFLHADTRLPFGYLQEVRRVLSTAGVAAGAWRFALDHVSMHLRWIERGTNLRARLLQLPYGDQAIFMTRRCFERLGGFREIPVMDDVDMVSRLRREGRIVIAGSSVVTSARRWRAQGVWRTTLRHQRALLWYMLGRDPHAISRMLGRGRPIGGTHDRVHSSD